MTIAVFNYGVWSVLYPDLATKVDAGQAQAYFDQVGALYIDNSDCSIVTDAGVRLQLMYLAVAHVATLGFSSAQGGSGLVGRVKRATEGSVTVEVDSLPGGSAWWAQTPYGFSVWAALAPYRTMQYVPGPVPQFGPMGPETLLGTQYFGGSMGAMGFPWR
jgi:hypothetical protein